jgi:arginase family enzyme
MKTHGRVNLPFTGVASLCKFPIHTDLKTFSVVGFNLVEVNPFLDPVALTQSAVVMIILELISVVFNK